MSSIFLPKVTLTPEQEAAMEAGRRRYELGRDAGMAGLPMPDGADAAAYRRAVIERRGRSGEAIVVCTSGTRCVKCGGVKWGHRPGCRCWPDGGWNFERNEREGCRVEWGALVLPQSTDLAVPLVFMTPDELRAAGKPVIDDEKGEPIALGVAPASTASAQTRNSTVGKDRANPHQE